LQATRLPLQKSVRVTVAVANSQELRPLHLVLSHVRVLPLDEKKRTAHDRPGSSTTRMLRRIASISLALAFAFFSACQSSHPPVHGIPNFGTVSPRHKIYRGGEPPTAESWAFLQSLGVHTVVKLNTEKESHDCGAMALHMKVIRRPINDQQQFLGSPDFSKTIDCAVGVMRRGGVFVHCGSDGRSKPNSFGALTDTQGGQDRTGLVVGCYRVRVEHWKKAKARNEMKSFHFHAMLLPGLARFWRDQVR
jgi:hypothetical protein